jgi:hypothetical protein
LQSVKRFRPEYISITLMVLVSVVLLLSFFTGVSSIKEVLTFSLIIVFLVFLTKDIKSTSTDKKSSNRAYKYIVLVFLFSYLTLF